MERNTVSPNGRKDVEEDISFSGPQSSPVPKMAFSSDHDLDDLIPKTPTSSSSAQGPQILPVLTTTPFKVGHKFYHASGKVFIVCDDHVIREVCQPTTNE